MLNKKDEKETQIQKDGGYIHTTYISAIQTLIIKEITQMESTEMGFLRSVAGYKRLNKIKKSRTSKELNIYDLSYKTDYRHDWKNYILRMDEIDFQNEFKL